jgi:hypothetical protein
MPSAAALSAGLRRFALVAGLRWLPSRLIEPFRLIAGQKAPEQSAPMGSACPEARASDYMTVAHLFALLLSRAAGYTAPLRPDDAPGRQTKYRAQCVTRCCGNRLPAVFSQVAAIRS